MSEKNPYGEVAPVHGFSPEEGLDKEAEAVDQLFDLVGELSARVGQRLKARLAEEGRLEGAVLRNIVDAPLGPPKVFQIHLGLGSDLAYAKAVGTELGAIWAPPLSQAHIQERVERRAANAEERGTAKYRSGGDGWPLFAELFRGLGADPKSGYFDGTIGLPTGLSLDLVDPAVYWCHVLLRPTTPGDRRQFRDRKGRLKERKEGTILRVTFTRHDVQQDPNPDPARWAAVRAFLEAVVIHEANTFDNRRREGKPGTKEEDGVQLGIRASIAPEGVDSQVELTIDANGVCSLSL